MSQLAAPIYLNVIYSYDYNFLCLNKHPLPPPQPIKLVNVQNWLCADKLSLNIDKTNFVLFPPL